MVKHFEGICGKQWGGVLGGADNLEKEGCEGVIVQLELGMGAESGLGGEDQGQVDVDGGWGAKGGGERSRGVVFVQMVRVGKRRVPQELLS